MTQSISSPENGWLTTRDVEGFKQRFWGTASFDHLEPFWTSDLYSAMTPGNVKKKPLVASNEFSRHSPRLFIAFKVIMCSMLSAWKAPKLREIASRNIISSMLQKVPNSGVQGSQYIVRKIPQGIEMITPEMLPKNMTTLMNQAASSWKRSQPHRTQTPQLFLPSQLGSGTQVPLLPTPSTFALKHWVLWNRGLMLMLFAQAGNSQHHT